MPKIVIREFDKTAAGSVAYANFAVVVPGYVKNNADVFDENGIYECGNRDEFKVNIGHVGPKNIVAVAAKAPTYEEEPIVLTEEKFTELVQNGNLYVATEKSEGMPIGKLVDAKYIFTKADTFNSEAKYVILTDEGRDEVTQEHYGNQIAWELLGLGYTVYYKKLDLNSTLSDSNWWAPLKDKSLYDFRYIVSGLLGNPKEVNTAMINLAKFEPESKVFDSVNVLVDGRGDCVALLDIPTECYLGKTQSEAIEEVNAAAKNIPNSKYAAVFAPTVTYAVVDNESDYNNKTFPASFHYLACAARAFERYAEWYAVAGYTRGISKYTVESVGCKFGEAAVNAFQRRASNADSNITKAVNPIIYLRGNTYLWGNRTAEALGAPNTADGDLRASHFLNIRQLCASIKKQVYIACRQFTFDPNSETLWTNFCNTIRPLLEKMKADQGIEDYKFVKVKTERKAFLSAVIRIVPIEAVEDFDISIYLEDSLGGTTVSVEE